MIVRGAAVEAVQVGDCGDQRETEAASRRARRVARAMEALEDRAHFPGSDARTVVRDRKRNPRWGALTSDLNPDSGRRMTQRIVDQVGDHLHEQLLVAGDRKRRVEALNQRLAFVFGSRRKRLRDLPRQLGEVKRPESRPPRASLDLADAEQGIEGFEHTLDVADHRIDRTAHRAR